MPEAGEDVALLTEQLAASDTLADTGEESVLFNSAIGRGESTIPDTGDRVILLRDDLCIGPATGPSGDFAVSIKTTNSPVQEGNTLAVLATVTNNQSVEQDGTITLQVGATERDSVNITLNGDESQDFNFTWDTEQGDAGDYTATVSSGTDSDNTQVKVKPLDTVPSGDFSLSLSRNNSPVAETASVVWEMDVTNNKSSEQDGNIVFEVPDGTYRDSVSVTVAADATTRIYLKWQTEDGDNGDYTGYAKSGIDTISDSVTVEDIQNPEEVTYTVDESLTIQDAQDDEVETVTVANVTDIRLVRCSVVYTQDTELFSTFGQVAVGIGDDPASTGAAFEPFDFNLQVRQDGSFAFTGVLDMGSVQSAELEFGVDDGTGTIGPA